MNFFKSKDKQEMQKLLDKVFDPPMPSNHWRNRLGQVLVSFPRKRESTTRVLDPRFKLSGMTKNSRRFQIHLTRSRKPVVRKGGSTLRSQTRKLFGEEGLASADFAGEISRNHPTMVGGAELHKESQGEATSPKET